jgi:2',3'-cyclic-nucleotide 2'-phosphodiesterase/3'-nucleotidase/5'-nucleotidase
LIPTDYVLNQNYPNPFNPVTTIRFGLPERNHVTLKVYNILGQDVATLVDEVKPAGYHIIHWNAEKLASGLYFTRMESGNKVRLTKMLLLK